MSGFCRYLILPVVEAARYDEKNVEALCAGFTLAIPLHSPDFPIGTPI